MTPSNRKKSTAKAAPPAFVKQNSQQADEFAALRFVGASDETLMRMNKKELAQLYQASALLSRSAMTAALGQTFNGARDVYEACGWPKTRSAQDYHAMYDYNGIASRYVDGMASETWRKPPVLIDGMVRGDEKDEAKLTPFLRDWKEFAEEYRVWSFFSELDSVLGYSQYGVIFIGAPGEYDTPLEKASKVAFLQVFDEEQATVSEKDMNQQSERYGLPIKYNLTFTDGNTKSVHWTRVIHCKEGRTTERSLGVPALQKPYNLLLDLEKVVGSSSEAFWLLIRKGVILTTQQGVELPMSGTPEYTQMKAEIDDFVHQLRRVMSLKGFDVNDMGADVVSGRDQHDLLIADIAGTRAMPQRILIGSEVGQLASTQDDANWADVVHSRQVNTCEVWVKDFTDRLIALGVIAAPPKSTRTGKPKYSLEWPSLFELNVLERGTLANSVASALSTFTGGTPEQAMELDYFLMTYFNYALPASYTAPTETEVQTEAPAEDSDKTPDEEDDGALQDETSGGE